VSVRNASVVYATADAPVHALSNIDLEIADGEFVALIGPSGCGKTTLMRVVADLEKTSAGEVLVNGVSPHDARLARAYGYVFQAPALFPWRTVLANVTLPLQIQGMPKAQAKRVALEHIERVGLKGFEGKYPWQLSGGMQQRVSIARALSFEPKILMMDEPFGALDEITRDRLNEQLQQLWQRERRTVLFVTHSIAEAVYLSTKIVVMSPRPGRIVKVIDSPCPTCATWACATPRVHRPGPRGARGTGRRSPWLTPWLQRLPHHARSSPPGSGRAYSETRCRCWWS